MECSATKAGQPLDMVRWFRFSRVPYGTVYLMQSARDRRLFKVGFTKRKTIERRAELDRVAGDNMKIVATVSMPWGRACETDVLRRLRANPFRKRDRRGTEWFWLGKNENIDAIEKRLNRSADRIARRAKFQLSWPKAATVRRFRAHSGLKSTADDI